MEIAEQQEKLSHAAGLVDRAAQIVEAVCNARQKSVPGLIGVQPTLKECASDLRDAAREVTGR